MNDLRRVELHSSIKARPAPVPISRKLATSFLGALIIVTMIVWFGFLGWGFVALLQWVMDHIRSIW